MFVRIVPCFLCRPKKQGFKIHKEIVICNVESCSNFKIESKNLLYKYCPICGNELQKEVVSLESTHYEDIKACFKSDNFLENNLIDELKCKVCDLFHCLYSVEDEFYNIQDLDNDEFKLIRINDILTSMRDFYVKYSPLLIYLNNLYDSVELSFGCINEDL